MVPGDVTPLLEALLFPGVLFLVAFAFFSEWVGRKVVAHLQNQVGPHRAGPAGILQPFADFLKLLAKLRALFARLRIVQAIRGAWTYLTPVAFLQVAVAQVAPVAIP